MFFEHETSSNYQEKARCQGTPVVIVVVLIFVLLFHIRLWWACLTKVLINSLFSIQAGHLKKRKSLIPG